MKQLMCLRWLAFTFALAAMACAGALAVQHVTGTSLPGCGAGRSCDQLTSGPWGQIAGIPVSYLGAIWFSGFSFTLLPEGRNIPTRSVFIAALSGLPASLMFLLVMLSEGKLCPWCLGTHVTNMLMIAALWQVRRTVTRISVTGVQTPEPGVASGNEPIPAEFAWLRTFASAIVGTAFVIGLLHVRHERNLAQQHQTAVAAMLQLLKSDGSKDAVGTADVEVSGRNRIGAADARWQVVIFHDYACADCGNLHRSLSAMLAGRTDVAVSFRHFPLCIECNPDFFSAEKPDTGEHGQSCRAARLVEAAAQLHGPDGFARLEDWMFDHKGKFSDSDLKAAAADWGWGGDALLKAAEEQEIRNLVTEDVGLGHTLRMLFTPSVYINGHFLTGDGSTANRLSALLSEL